MRAVRVVVRWTPLPSALAFLPLILSLAGCELQEITIAQAEPFVVVESYLIAAGGTRPWAAIHSGSDDGGPTTGAAVAIHGPDGTVQLRQAESHHCVLPGIDPNALPGRFTCYLSPSLTAVRAGELYRLEVVLADGSRLSGATRVPDQVEIVMPRMIGPCYLPPWTQRAVVWRQTPGATAYVIDMVATGLRSALEREGIVVDIDDPLLLRGLAVGIADTSIVVPGEVGLFDRFVLDPDVLPALQTGVPEGVDVGVVVAAVDQNYVNWARGGDFNPSGVVRVPSVRGAGGTGVFASLSAAGVGMSSHDEDAGRGLCGHPPD